MSNFEESVNKLDLALFEKIASQSTNEDKGSLLACQAAVRELRPKYNYLEIGSYLGGSIQPYLLDDRCAHIYSIDKRPEVQPDERGFDWVYQNNSTARMIENLKAVSGDGIKKITAIDGDTGSIKRDEIKEKIDLCFIDGEHTDGAVMSDFKFCLDALGGTGAVIFHDAQITYNGISDCLKYLQKNSVRFNAYVLPHIVFVVEIGDFPMHDHPRIHERLVNNYEGYLFSLQDNDHYRRFANRTPFRLLRNFVLKVRRANVSH